MRTDHRKIDIIIRGKGYACSTTWSRTCKEAKSKYLAKHRELRADQVVTTFSKNN